MALVYLLVGIFIFVRQDFYGLGTSQRIGLGALVTGYGIYRVIKGIIRYRSSKDDE
jgi:uncharacterized membrane protein